jgi:hypothetical protein
MAKTWLSIRVELIGGRGETLWPIPGRIFAVGPSHTFAQLGEAVDLAFARWDLAHLRRFDLPDGRVVTDPETAEDLENPMVGDPVSTLDIDTVRVLTTVEPGSELRYVFDFGDDWTHRLSAGDERIDPVEMLGIAPRTPMAYWGGGTVPDQYGRRWIDDEGDGDPPSLVEDPMLLDSWPQSD